MAEQAAARGATAAGPAGYNTATDVTAARHARAERGGAEGGRSARACTRALTERAQGGGGGGRERRGGART